MPRYQGFTIDGGLIFSADTAQRIGEKAAEHIKRDGRPRLAYTFDNAGGAFPYTAWRANGAGDVPGVTGTPCATFDDVVNVWRKG